MTDSNGNAYVLAVGPTVYAGVASQAIYYAANIAGADVDKTGWTATRIGWAAYIVPFLFAVSPSLLHELAALGSNAIPCNSVLVGAEEGTLPEGVRQILDPTGLLAQRCDARPGTVYLFRPDQHVCARWRSFDAARVRSAVARATGQLITEAPSCSTPNPTSPRPTTSIRT